MADITIRPIEHDDQEAWRKLWTGYLEFYQSSVPEEVYRETFKRLCDKNNSEQSGFLALQGGVPVGLVHYIFHAHNWRIEQVCYLQDLYTAPEARGMGAGRKLIEAVYSAADAAGCPSVYWLTQEFNHTARQLYDRIATLTPFIKYQR
jgi:GNAT superfamily N-acetyltransferase